MAEVVEINIISRVVLDNDILFSFIHEQVEIQGNRTIEAMNNWAYEGLHKHLGRHLMNRNVKKIRNL